MCNTDVSKVIVTNDKAIISLIFGVCSIIVISSMVGFVLGIIGLILGIIGLSEIKRLNQEGRLIVIFGIVCSSLSILLPILLATLVYLNADSSTISYLQ